MKKLILSMLCLLALGSVLYAGGNGVTSVFGRTGAVVAQAGDYNVSLVTGAAPLASPAFSGTPTASTPGAGDNSTKIATTAFVQAALPAAPVRVANQSFLSQTTGLTQTTIFTPPSDGNYRVSLYATSLSGFGTGLSLSFELGWTDDSGPAGICSGDGGGESNGGTVFDTCSIFSAFATAGGRDIVLHAKGGDAITLATEEGSTAFTYNLYVIVERL